MITTPRCTIWNGRCELDPDCPYALGGLLLVRQYGGDWRDFDAHGGAD